MRDDGNARRPKARVFLGTGDLAFELLGKLAIDRGDMHARFFENVTAQHRHFAATQIDRLVAALPFFAGEGGASGSRASRRAHKSSRKVRNQSTARCLRGAQRPLGRGAHSGWCVGLRVVHNVPEFVMSRFYQI